MAGFFVPVFLGAMVRVSKRLQDYRSCGAEDKRHHTNSSKQLLVTFPHEKLPEQGQAFDAHAALAGKASGAEPCHIEQGFAIGAQQQVVQARGQAELAEGPAQERCIARAGFLHQRQGLPGKLLAEQEAQLVDVAQVGGHGPADVQG